MIAFFCTLPSTKKRSDENKKKISTMNQQEKPISNIQFVSQWTWKCESPLFRKQIENSHSVCFVVVFTIFVWNFHYSRAFPDYIIHLFQERSYSSMALIYETFGNQREFFIKNESFSRVIF